MNIARRLGLVIMIVLAIFLPRAAGAQGALSSGAMATGSISPIGDSDTWTFSANAGDAIVVRIGEISQTGGFTPRLRIFSPSAALLSTSYAPTAAEVAVTAASGGTYTVVVDDLNGTSATGTYRITLAQSGSAVTVSPGDEGGPLTNGALHSGTIDVGDLDVWTVTANAGDAIVVRMGEAVAGSALTPNLRIYSPAGALLDQSYAPAAAEVATTAPSSGTYLVVVGDLTGYWTGSGSYHITLAQSGTPVTVSPGDEGGPLTNGALHSGTIDVGDLDLWTVTANAGDAIIVRMGEAVAGSALTPNLRIYSPAGALLDQSYAPAAAEVVTTAPSSGTYLVVVGDLTGYWTGSGSYHLTLAKTGTPVTVSPGDEGGPLTNGALHSGTIDVGDLDLWTVTANAGDAIIVRMGEAVAGSALTPNLRIYSPAGALLDQSYAPAAAEVVTTAPSSGTYLVVVGDLTGYWTGSGSYHLTLAKTGTPVTVSPGDEGGPLTNGALHTGMIDVGDLDVWTVTANAGDAIVARMGETVSGSALTPNVRIYSPAGVLLDQAYAPAAAEVATTAPSSGTYLVVVGDLTGYWTGSGTYRLSLAKTGTPVTVSPGDEGGPLTVGNHTGIIDVGDLDVWTIAANVNDPLIVTMEEVNPGSSLTPELRLYSPAGALLRSSYGTTYAQVSATAPATGTYLVVCGDLNGYWTGSGPYRLTPSATTAVGDPPHAGPLTLAFAPASPNPFTARTLLKYEIPRTGAASLRLYDLEGRLVLTLVDETSQAAGDHEVAWDGRDASGSIARPGIYMARLEAGGRPLVQKVVLSR